MAESVTYLTDAELLQLGLPGDALSAVGVTVRDAQRKASSDWASSHLKKRYGLPLITWGEDLKRAVAHHAALALMEYRGFDPAGASGERIVARADAAAAWMRDVARGIVEPVDVTDTTPDTDEAAPLISSDTPAGWEWPTESTATETC